MSPSVNWSGCGSRKSKYRPLRRRIVLATHPNGLVVDIDCSFTPPPVAQRHARWACGSRYARLGVHLCQHVVDLAVLIASRKIVRHALLRFLVPLVPQVIAYARVVK